MMILYLIVLGLVAMIAQMTLPPLDFIPGGNANLMPIVIIFGVLRMRNFLIFIVTVILGWCMDLNTPDFLGAHVISLSLVAALMLTQVETRLSRNWFFQIFLVMVGSFLYFVIEYGLICLQLWRWDWPANVWNTFAFNSILNAALVIVLFPLFSIPPFVVNLFRRRRQENQNYVQG